jgi:hypothetical protein
MKGHKGHRKHRETGGVNEAEMDLKDHPQRYNQSKVEDEAEERKHGGRTKKHAKHAAMKVHGKHAAHHAGRKPRKSGGRTSSDSHPFTSARHGTPPKGRKLEMEFE